MNRLFTYGLGFIGCVYLLNMGFGVGELIPDNLPLAGNIDEAVASMLVFKAYALFRKTETEK